MGDAFCSDERDVTMQRKRDYSVGLRLTGHKGGVLCCCYSPTGSYVLSGAQDRLIMLWNAETGRLITKFDGHGQAVRSVACSKDSSTVLSGSSDKTLLVWDVGRGSISRKLRHDGEVNAVCFNPENSVALSASADRLVQVWDLRARSFTPIQLMQDAKDAVSSLAVSKYEILAASLDGHVRQYDVRKGGLVVDQVGPPVMGASYSNDFNCVLTQTLDSKVRLFDKATGELLNQYTGHVNRQYKTQATLTSDDAHVISGSEDHT